MPLRAVDLAYIRSEIGPEPADAALDDIYARLGNSVPAVLLEVLRGRMAAVIAEPAGYSIAGVYTQNTRPVASIIKALQEQMARISAAASPTGTPVPATETVLTRARIVPRRPRR